MYLVPVLVILCFVLVADWQCDDIVDTEGWYLSYLCHIFSLHYEQDINYFDNGMFLPQVYITGDWDRIKPNRYDIELSYEQKKKMNAFSFIFLFF